MSRNKSQRSHLLSTARQRKTYFYVRNFTSLIIGAAVFNWSNEKMGGIFAIILALLSIVIAYKTVAHYLSLFICELEEFLGG